MVMQIQQTEFLLADSSWIPTAGVWKCPVLFSMYHSPQWNWFSVNVFLLLFAPSLSANEEGISLVVLFGLALTAQEFLMSLSLVQSNNISFLIMTYSWIQQGLLLETGISQPCSRTGASPERWWGYFWRETEFLSFSSTWIVSRTSFPTAALTTANNDSPQEGTLASKGNLMY